MKFQDAIAKNVAKFDDPHFLARIKEEDATMVKYMPIMQKLNQLGFITETSQAGRSLKNRNFETGEPQEMIERAYVCGFMQREKAKLFVQGLNIAGFNAYAVMVVPDELDESDENTQIDFALGIPLTITIKPSGVITHTKYPPAMSRYTFNNLLSGLSLNKSDNLVFLYCWDSKFNRNGASKNGLFTEILRELGWDGLLLDLANQ